MHHKTVLPVRVRENQLLNSTCEFLTCKVFYCLQDLLKRQFYFLLKTKNKTKKQWYPTPVNAKTDRLRYSKIQRRLVSQLTFLACAVCCHLLRSCDNPLRNYLFENSSYPYSCVFINIKLMISVRKTSTQLRDMIKKISKNKANSCCICWAEVNKIWYQLNE